MKNIRYLLNIFILLLILLIHPISSEAAVKTIAIQHFQNGSEQQFFGELAADNLAAATYEGLKDNKNYTLANSTDTTDYVLGGRVINAEFIPFDFGIYKTVKAKVTTEIHLTEIKTGNVLTSEIVSGTASQLRFSELNNLHSNLTPAELPFDSESLMKRAAVDTSKVILAKLDYINPLIGTVLKVNKDEKMVYFNIGTNDDKIQKGDTYIVFREGRPLVNPETGEFIALKKDVLAKIKIKRVKSNYAAGKIDEEFADFGKGDKVQRGDEQ